MADQLMEMLQYTSYQSRNHFSGPYPNGLFGRDVFNQLSFPQALVAEHCGPSLTFRYLVLPRRRRRPHMVMPACWKRVQAQYYSTADVELHHVAILYSLGEARLVI